MRPQAIPAASRLRTQYFPSIPPSPSLYPSGSLPSTTTNRAGRFFWFELATGGQDRKGRLFWMQLEIPS